MLAQIEAVLPTHGILPDQLPEQVGDGDFASVFATTELAVSTVHASVAELCRLASVLGVETGACQVDRRLSSLWFNQSLEPLDWELPSLWDPIAGDYLARDGWIRLHTNAPHHREVVCKVLQCSVERESVAREVLKRDASDLESEIVELGGCAAAMHSQDYWAKHAQSNALRKEPLIKWQSSGSTHKRLGLAMRKSANRGQLLQGLRVLDLTRVLAGPVCTRFLAALGADVLRIDPFDWNEAQPTIEMSVGKRRAGLNLKSSEGLAQLKLLMSEADVLVHGYRPDALARLGLAETEREALNPGLIDVALCAYGWSGPWSSRRGFDSLVQMSSGIAEQGMCLSGANKPVPLPAQALDHGTGYLMAAAVLNALTQRELTGESSSARLSLARTGMLLADEPVVPASLLIDKAVDGDYLAEPETTDWGLVRRLRFPFHFDNIAIGWSIPAGELRVHKPQWS